MAFKDSMTKGVDSDSQINSHYKNLLDDYLDTTDSDGEEVKDLPNNTPPSNGQGYQGPMKSKLMNFTQMLEAMDDVADSMDTVDTMDTDTGAEVSDVDENEILDELNKLFTPVLVMQNFEKEISDQENSELAESGMLTERNVIKFDDETRMSQLIGVCAKLLAKKKNTESWQMYAKAAAIKKQASINIQKEEYDQARSLAQKYLVMVSTTNNSSVARDAANDLLPQTNH